MLFRWLGGFILVPVVFLAGCLLPPEPATPIRAVWDHGEPDTKTLIVFLPGRHDRPEDFFNNGFGEVLRDAGIRADLVAVDAHLGYYYRQVLPERIREDILVPARERGYEQIWAVGISLGGLGAVLLQADLEDPWDGMVLIAPFVGDEPGTMEAVRAAPSLAEAALYPDFAHDDYTAKFWHQIRYLTTQTDMPIYLTYGSEDRMAADQALLARELPAENVLVRPGDHTWDIWKELWAELVRIIELGVLHHD